MQKIGCPVCGKQFVWTDDHPSRGKCPNPDCERQYNVHAEIRRGLSKRAKGTSAHLFRCPECSQALHAAWGRCDGCGILILAGKSLNPRKIAFIGILILVLLSLGYQYYF